jgi:hypothetical protein
MTVLPETATDTPSRSREAPPEAVSFAVWVPSAHPGRGLTTPVRPTRSTSPSTGSAGNRSSADSPHEYYVAA